MASSIINSDDGVVSGTSGIKSTGGDDGTLVFQSKGTETARINTDKQIVAAAGTVLLPVITTTGDTNTGIFFPAADTIAFAEGGAEAMRIDSSGNVGIGTTTALSPLTALGTSSTVSNPASTRAPIASIRGGNNNNRFEFYVDNSGATSVMGLGAYNTAGGATAMTFYTGVSVSEAMRIDSSGNVGIGTSSPGTRLSVAGDSESLRLTPSAGVSSTASTFGTFRNGGGILYIGLDSSTGASFNTGGYGGVLWHSGAYPLVFATSNTERLRIDSAGALILAGSTAQKATGTTWSNPSDIRLKDNIRDYAKGMAELMQVRVREWEYNGKGGTIAGTKGLGVVADEAMLVLPDTVDTYEAKLDADDEQATAIKKFDATEITWLLVKAIQELKAELDTVKENNAVLEARIAAIENGA